jgi:hypothetical protein
VCLAEESVTNTAALVGVSRAVVSKVMSADTIHRKTTKAKRNSGRKPAFTERGRLLYIERDCLKKNSRTTAAQVTE